MIHTFKLRWEIENHHIDYFKRKHDLQRMKLTSYINTKFRGIKAGLIFGTYANAFTLFVDVPLVLNRGDVVERDYDVIKESIQTILEYAFNDPLLYEQQNLTRIDYRIDVVVPEPNLRKVYFSLFKKTTRKVYRLKKSLGKFNKNQEYYEYKTSVYHQSQSTDVVVYDKNAERMAKNKLPEQWEKDCVRFEVQIGNNHLRYMKSKGNTKVLETYFTANMFHRYVDRFLKKIYLTGDYYTFNEAEKVIHGSNFTFRKKVSLIDFLKFVAAGNLTTPKSRMSPGTYRSRIKDFEELGLNPITIPQSVGFKGTCLPNLLKDKYIVSVRIITKEELPF